ncbi:esterase [Devosia yakushimensis]|uniref:Esterase n=1 Tax=Devosia yakushimensis TaxID=470028 RepID=A0ABQ5UB48_9HYPH|nr:esterase [Devosia yakushimensis]
MMVKAFLLALLLVLPCPALAGTLESQSFPSPGMGGTIKALIYRPDGNPPPSGWPVIYLLHGLGGDETSWRDLGHIQPTLDDMMGQSIKPALVVMPGAGPESWYVDSRAIGGPGDSETAIVKDLRAAIEATYPVRKDRGGRAIAGLSMGGYGALRLALGHPDLFAAAASLSGAIWQNVPSDQLDLAPEAMALIIDSTYFHHNDPADISTGIDLPPVPPHFGSAFGNPFDARRFNSQNVFTLLAAAIAEDTALPALFLTVGDDDSHKLWRGAIAFYETMQADNRPIEFRVTNGDHSWDVWSTSIRDALRFIDSQWQAPR